MEERPEIKTYTKDGIKLGVGNIPVAEKMFFYERFNGSIFNVGEQDAAKIHSKFKFLGQSDGTQYANAVRVLQGKFQELTKGELRTQMLEAWQRELEIAKGNMNSPILEPLDMKMREQTFRLKVKDSVT